MTKQEAPKQSKHATGQAKQRIKKLKVLINKYRYHRLVLDKPIIEESVEDSLKK